MPGGSPSMPWGSWFPWGCFGQKNGAGSASLEWFHAPGTRRPRRGFREAEEKGALPPLRSPFSNLGHHAPSRVSLKSAESGVRGRFQTGPAPLWPLETGRGRRGAIFHLAAGIRTGPAPSRRGFGSGDFRGAGPVVVPWNQKGPQRAHSYQKGLARIRTPFPCPGSSPCPGIRPNTLS